MQSANKAVSLIGNRSSLATTRTLVVEQPVASQAQDTRLVSTNFTPVVEDLRAPRPADEEVEVLKARTESAEKSLAELQEQLSALRVEYQCSKEQELQMAKAL